MTPVPDYIAGARALLAASDCTIDGEPAVVVRVAELNDLVARAHRAEAAPLPSPHVDVQGRCPACGCTRLILGEGGYVTCPRIDCPEPDAASTLLERGTDSPPTSGDGRPAGEGLRGLLEHVGIDLTGKTVRVADGPTIAQMHADNARTTPDSPAVAAPATPGRATITIAVTAPNQDNADRWAGTIRDLVRAEYGHHMRLDITVGSGEADR